VAIQRSFGDKHDVSGIKAHVGGASATSCDAIGASAYATGNNVAFQSSPDLHTAAHEAAHVIQQRHGSSSRAVWASRATSTSNTRTRSPISANPTELNPDNGRNATYDLGHRFKAGGGGAWDTKDARTRARRATSR